MIRDAVPRFQAKVALVVLPCRPKECIHGRETLRGRRRLAAPYRFAITTPPVRRLGLDWYRPNRGYDSPMVLALRLISRSAPHHIAVRDALGRIAEVSIRVT